MYDATVIGSGPNGLAAAITLAQAGLSVALYEAKSTIGGGTRSGEITLPGYIHDICSAIHPLCFSSPFFQTLPLADYGLEWIQPSAPLAHPLDNGTAVLLERSLDLTSQNLGVDGKAYKKLMEPFITHWRELSEDVLKPFHFPEQLYLMLRLGFYGVRSAESLLKSQFQGQRAQALFAGLAAHSILPLNQPITAAFGLILGILGHAVGWPIARGGSQNIANALGAYFQSLGGKIFCDANIQSISEVMPCKIILCDVTPKQLLQMAKNHLPESYKKRLENYRYGPGVFKIDWALKHPIPWKAKECLKAGTVHIGGTADEIISSEKAIGEKYCPEKPYVLLAQQSLFDPSRAPIGKQTAWGYCHVPNGSEVDMTDRIEAQIERFAPGFRDCIEAKSIMTSKDIQLYNPNYIGGDINGGMQDIYQLFSRPVVRIVPYSTPLKGLYICSSSTPPGGGVHGMCGYNAAKAALKASI